MPWAWIDFKTVVRRADIVVVQWETARLTLLRVVHIQVYIRPNPELLTSIGPPGRGLLHCMVVLLLLRVRINLVWDPSSIQKSNSV